MLLQVCSAMALTLLCLSFPPGDTKIPSVTTVISVLFFSAGVTALTDDHGRHILIFMLAAAISVRFAKRDRTPIFLAVILLATSPFYGMRAPWQTSSVAWILCAVAFVVGVTLVRRPTAAGRDVELGESLR